jgi:SWI/SNF-related matrix-associated actin-dependent regulator of chromatin subfamily A containing DEAD/H box 1
MDSDPISSSPPQPAKPRQTSPEYPTHRQSSPATADYVSSPAPAASYITQPTQPIGAAISEILVPRTSPTRPSTLTNNDYTQEQIRIFSRMAPPGTYANVPRPAARAPSQSQTQFNAPVQLDSDDDDLGIVNLISDSEDELNDSDPANIPPAPIVTTSFNRLKGAALPTKPNMNRTTSMLNQRLVVDYQNDFKAREIQKILPDRSYDEIVSQLRRHHWNKDDTISSFFANEETAAPPVVTISDDDAELLTPIKPSLKTTVRMKPPKLMNKHTIENKKSLAQKYNQPQVKRQNDLERISIEPPQQPFPSSQPESPPKPKRRRLIRGTERVASKETSAEPEIEPLRKKKIVLQHNFDESDSDASVQEVEPFKDTSDLLDFFNTCEVKELADVASTTEDIAKLIISKRKFRSLEQIRKIQGPEAQSTKGRGSSKKRAIGDKVVDVAEQMWESLMAIDRLLGRCDEIGRSVRSGMEQLSLSTNGNEIEATELKSTGVDSGIGTPTPSPGIVPRLEQPSIMAADFKLKDYQVVALNWLNLMYSSRVSPILADEMGLGKTACVIAFISHLWEQGKRGTHLIIVPGSTLENWIREFKRFSPKINVYAYHGSQAERRGMRLEVLDNPPEVIVTTYDMAQNKDDNRLFRSVKPITTVFDEGHMLKNKNSKRYNELMRIQTPWRLLLTGTPLQNNLQELVSILGFIMPDIFRDVDEHLSYIFKHRAKTTDKEHTALLSAKRIDRAKKMMAPFILRRKKEQVLKSMPKKTSRIVYCDMTLHQKEVYDDYTSIHEEALQNRAAGIVTEQRNHLMNRRKAAIHPLLFRYIYLDPSIEKIHKKIPPTGKFRGWSRERMLEEMSWWSDYKIHQTCLEYAELKKHALKDEEWMDSGKVTKLVELVKQFAAEESRTLVFSQFTQVLDILESVFETEDIRFCRLDGSTNIAQRQEYIDEFHNNEELQVFMLSTKSGGTGINLACANKVIIFDSSFNPHDDVQAENRAHRVGQTREVEVVRLVTRGTIEEQIHRLGQSKLALDQLVSGMEEKVADEKGMALVEKMLLGGSSHDVSGAVSEADDGKLDSKMKVVKHSGDGDAPQDIVDVKDAFLNGLKAAGLNVQA